MTQSPESESSNIKRATRRPFVAVWRKWSALPVRTQERLAFLIPLLTVALFMMVVLGAYWFIRTEEKAREEQMLEQQSHFLALRMNEQLFKKQEEVQRLVYGMVTPATGIGFDKGARALMAQDLSLYSLTWFDTHERVISTHQSAMLPSRLRRLVGQVWDEGELEEMPQGHWAVIGQNTTTSDNTVVSEPPVLRLFVPIRINGVYLGTVVAEYAPQMLLNEVLSQNTDPNLAVALINQSGRLIAGSATLERFVGGERARASSTLLAPTHLVLPIGSLGDQLQLSTAVYRSDRSITRRALLALLTLLGLSTAGMLLMNWRLSRRRLQAQRRLEQESSFRLAIENSLTTGIRVLDLEGVTTYTNAAFSRMVGWTQAEMVGMKAPFPYWPRKDREILTERFQSELSGKHYPGGLQLRMRRKNGTTFDARIFLSPLMNERGMQTGWLTTINDITEPNRIRQQLAAAHDRFTLVLESLDASITVAPLGSNELVFANRLYRQWFGSQSQGHMLMLAQAGASNNQRSGDDTNEEDALMGLPTDVITTANSEHAEIYIESLGKWLEIRSRYLDWVDGRLAQMLIATDITKRKQAEEQAARQVEKMEAVSRLMTMGEMASSVAHELNQPLAAISNYTNGMITRIKAGKITLEQMVEPLEKTAHQALRAGQVIHRIRSFVKRSASNQEPCAPQRLVAEAIELANIEIRKHNARLNVHLAPNLPAVEVDAILIEQVLINLLKNAAEAINAANRPVGQRSIDLDVRKDNAGVLFTITDQGTGMPEDALQQLFDAFYSTKKDGMGIGLNLCRSIVESHQGKMQVRNLYNEDLVIGCEFSFWLPASSHKDDSADGLPGPILG
ncbi:PAS domain S-box protein [Lampropedia aestuarii]|uniref:histidine kinase n=1 Tax=Lampropedia aestuarii TaxID=2562762 RepID=A0A4S5BW31_9BURK|nr:PAS domain S-box protein [Lampropedia aestuarii]MDH5855871.1 PAS domain S-box protein [Lampropedia aestuarii]THJ35583.1 PAS domain S-box protein [Lampropedia aestuarii]